MSGQLNELRLQVERLDYDNKESIITIDILKEQNQDAKNELEEFKKTITELKSSQKDASADDKEKRKQEKMAMMMAKFDAVRYIKRLVLFTLLMTSIYSKGHSPRRTYNSVKYWPSSIPSTMQTLYHPFLSMTSCLFVDNWRRASHSCARLSTASDKVKRRMRCTHAGVTNWSLVSLPWKQSTRNY